MLFSALFRKNITSYEDRELVQLIRKGNKHALGEIFRRYSHLIMGLCLKYMKDHAKAEDLMMHVFEHLTEKIRKGEISNFKSWLYTVARNECLMELRKKKKEFTSSEDTLLYTADDSKEELESFLIKEHELSQLEEAIEHLKPQQKESIILFYLKRKSYDEITQIMKIDLKKVKSLIQNGKRNLRIKMEES